VTRPTRRAKTDPIRGSVARIEDEHTLIINRGSDHDVTEGMVFGVLADDGDRIIDPETGLVIGELPSVKLRVRVSEVHPKYSRAETFDKYQPPPTRMPSGPLGLFADDASHRLRIDELLGPSPEMLKAVNNTKFLETISKIAAAEMANPTPRRQQVVGAKTEQPKQPAVRPEVTVNIGDRVEQERNAPIA